MILTTDWINARALWMLQQNFKSFRWAYDASAWLRDNLPTLGKYTRQ